VSFSGIKLPTAAVACLAFAVIFPWMLPPGGGPAPSLVPWLFSLGCVGVWGGLLPVRRPFRAHPFLLSSGGLLLAMVLREQNAMSLAVVASVASVSLVALAIDGCKGAIDISFGPFVARCWLVAALISSLIGLSQYFGFAHHFEPWMSQSVSGEVFGNLRQRNQFASLCNIGLIALLYLANRAAKQGQRISAAPVYLFVAIVLAINLNVSSSRTGLLQLMLLSVMVLVWGGWRRSGVRALLISAWAGYGFAMEILPLLYGLDPASLGVLGRIQDPGPSCASRWTLWRNVLELTNQHPWLGWGWGELDYAHFINLYDGPRFCEILDNAHNLPLHLAVELGIPAAFVLCAVFSWIVVRAKPWAETEPERQMAWLVLGVILIHSMLEYPLWYGPFQMALGLCVGLLLPDRSDLPIDSNGIKKEQIFMRGFACLLVAGTAYAAWDYHRISQIYLAPDERSETYLDNTLEKLKVSWLFRDQVRFAELTTTELTPDNAVHINMLAKEVMHYSPEARVVQKVIESAIMLGHSDEALYFMQRFKAAYPQDYDRWASENVSVPLLKIP
jgi:O-antigen ligase